MACADIMTMVMSMAMAFKFTVNSAPEGKARPRVTAHGTYTPRGTRQYEDLVRWEYKRQGGPDFGSIPLRVTITAFFQLRRSATKLEKLAAMTGELFPAKKPDADNIAKAICDAVELTVRKRYGPDPSVDVEVSEYDEQDL